MFRKIALIILFFGFYSPLFAQVPPVDLVFEPDSISDSLHVEKKYEFISENLLEERLLNLFSTRETITQEEIDNSIIRSWGDILNLRKGMGVIDYSNLGQPQILQMNGSTEQIGIVADDFQYINHPFRFPYIGGLDLSYLPMENVEEVEVVSSGLANVLCDDASFGVVKIKNKEFQGEKAFSKVLYQKAPYNFRRTQLELGKDFTSRAIIYLTAGFKRHDGYLLNNISESMYLTFAGKYALKEDWNMGIGVLRYRGKRGLPHTEYFNLKSITEYSDDWGINFKLIHKSDENLLSHLRLNYYRMKQRFNSSNFTVFREDLEEIFGLGVEHQFLYGEKHSFWIKGNWTYNRLEEDNLTDDVKETSLCLTDLFGLNKKINLLFLVKLNQASKYDICLSPMLGTSYKVNQNSNLFFTLGSFCGFPTIRDLYLDSISYDLSLSSGEDFVIKGKDDLKSQRSLMANLGYSLSKDSYKFGLNIYRSRLENSVGWKNQDSSSFLGSWIPLNQDLNLYGAKLDLDINPKENMKFFISYAFQKTEDANTSFSQPFVPEHSIFCYLEYSRRLLKDEIELGGRIENNFISSYYTAEEEREKQKNIDILSLRFTFSFLDLTSYYVIENLNDKSYKTFLGYPAPRRTHWFGFSWQFFN